MALPQPKTCLDTFVKYSLLDEYFHHDYVHSYRMHRLIKEFLKEKVTQANKRRFWERYSEYFEDFLMLYVKGGLRILDEVEEYKFMLETQNIHTFLGLLISQKRELTPNQLAILSYGVNQDLVSFRSIEQLSRHFIKKLTDVCSILDSDSTLCGKFYSLIIEPLYTECMCENMSNYFQNLLNSSCPCTSSESNGVFQCHTVYDINHAEIVWVHISTPIQKYLERVMLYNCYHDHVFAVNFIIVMVLLVLSVLVKAPTCKKCAFLLTLYFIATVLHSLYQIKDNWNRVTIAEILLKTICYKLLFLLLLCMFPMLVQTTRDLLFMAIPLIIFYYTVYILWCDTTYPLQGCDFLPLCQ